MLKVGIVGAGIGGLSAGLMLSSIGCRVTIFEKLPQNSSSGLGIQISANGIRALSEFGLEHKIGKIGDYPDSIDLFNGSTGKKVTNIPLGNTAQELYKAGFYQFHRGDLISLLMDENIRLGGNIIFKSPVLDIKQDLNGVTVITNESSFYFDFLVAADGINSVVRNLLFEKNLTTFLNQVAYRAVVPASQLPKVFSSGKTQIFFGSGKHVVSYPIRKGSLVNFVFCTEFNSFCKESWDIIVNPSEVRGKFSEFLTLKEVFKKLNNVKKWGLFEHVYLNNWYKKRVVLLGDACHPMLPYLAQGATQAIEDSLELCRRIKISFNHGDLELELKKYSNNRSSRVKKIRQASRLNAKLFHLKNPLLIFIFHFVLKITGLIHPKFLLKRFSWIYAGGPAETNKP